MYVTNNSTLTSTIQKGDYIATIVYKKAIVPYIKSKISLSLLADESKENSARTTIQTQRKHAPPLKTIPAAKVILINDGESDKFDNKITNDMATINNIAATVDMPY